MLMEFILDNGTNLRNFRQQFAQTDADQPFSPLAERSCQKAFAEAVEGNDLAFLTAPAEFGSVELLDSLGIVTLEELTSVTLFSRRIHIVSPFPVLPLGQHF